MSSRDESIKHLAQGIANKALSLDWRDTESQARRVAETAGEAMYELVVKAGAVRTATNLKEQLDAVEELLNFIGVPANG